MTQAYVCMKILEYPPWAASALTKISNPLICFGALCPSLQFFSPVTMLGCSPIFFA